MSAKPLGLVQRRLLVYDGTVADPPASGSPRKPALSVTPTPPEPPGEPVLKALLDITKSEIDTEFKISERYETKARTFFGFAVVLFGVTQAYVLRSDFTALSGSQRGILEVAIIAAAITFGAALTAVMYATLQRSDRTFDHLQLFELARDRSTDLAKIVEQYIVLLGERREANDDRQHRLKVGQSAALVATLFTALEFVLAAVYFI